MKVTKQYLKQLIKEQIEQMSEEGELNEARPTYLGDIASYMLGLDEKTLEALLAKLGAQLGQDDKKFAATLAAVSKSTMTPAAPVHE
jgi:hypothetical protein